MAIRMQQRRGMAEQWNIANPILAEGEIGLEIDTNRFKIGNGSSRWSALAYFVNSEGLAGSLDDYVPLTAVGTSVAQLVDGKVPAGQLPDIGELSQDAVNEALTAGTGITKNYDDVANTLTISVDTDTIATKSYVTTELGNIDLSAKQDVVDGVSSTEIGYLDGVTSAIQEQLDAKLNLAGGTMTDALTLAGAPTQANHAATKAYVDSISEGLHIHQSVVALADSNIALPTAPSTLDGVALSLNDRILLTKQTNAAENGIYVVINGDLARAADYNTAVEIQAGDFVFVAEGTTYNSTSWVQKNAVTTLGTDPIVWSQFAGIGTITAGNGIVVTGSEVAVDFDDVATKTHTHPISDVTDLQTALDGKAATSHTHNASAIAYTIESKNANYTIVAGDKGKIIRSTGAGITVTLGDAGLSVGDVITFLQSGAGQITFVPGGDETIVSVDNKRKTSKQHSTVQVLRLSAGTYLLFGDLAA